MNRPVHLDFNATTPLDHGVLETITSGMKKSHGNPSSSHDLGRSAKTILDIARHQTASALGCEAREVIFTGSGSEGNNLALKGAAYFYGRRGNHIITTAVEHPSVLNPLSFLKFQGFRVTVLPVNGFCRVDPLQVEESLTTETLLVSVMLANNEVGTIQPIKSIANLCRARNILIHSDASQAMGKILTRVDDFGVDLLTTSGHKIYGPKGVGALYVRSGIQLEPLIHGGGQEGGMRSGTENVSLIAGLGKAFELIPGMLGKMPDVRRLRDQLFQMLREGFKNLVLNGHPEERLPNTLNVSFSGVDTGQLMSKIKNRVFCSYGSACHSGRLKPSPVLLAMGKNEETAVSSLRFSLGIETTEEEIIDAAVTIVGSIRNST